jgi:hypothetical protein
MQFCPAKSVSDKAGNDVGECRVEESRPNKALEMRSVLI